MKRLLVFHQGALGDLVTLFPVLIRLRDRYQAVDVICNNQIGRLARYLGLIETAWPAEAAIFSPLFGDAPQPAKLLEALKPYDTILLFSYSDTLQQNIASLTSARVHLIPPRPLPGQKIHITDYYCAQLELVSLLGPSSDFQVAPVSRQDWRDCDFDPKRVLLHPGSGSRRKNWPLDHFLLLREQLIAAGFQTPMLIGPAEEPINTENVEPIERPESLIGLAQTLKRTGAFIGNDSGVSHLAAFLGVPTVAIFGPSDPIRWAPRGRKVAVVQLPGGCDPCFEVNPFACESMDCLERLSPATVMAKLATFYPR